MIPATELMQGSVVLRRYWNPQPGNERFCHELCAVDIVKPETVNLRLRDGSILGKVPLEDISPVEISPDVLERCGFQIDGFKAYNLTVDAEFGHYRILSFAGDYLYLREGCLRKSRTAQDLGEFGSLKDVPTPASGGPEDDLICLWNKDKLRTFHLHRLQALYFGLTLKPLTVKIF